MNDEHNHMLTIIDFMKTGHNTYFVKVVGFDADAEREFEGEVKFVQGMPFGDLIHPQRSYLSSTCREFVRENLINRYDTCQFN
ncbi:hypothetical protein [Peribacillus sp. NPDC096540]|uniref:hypothetical protein n=1 Tax=Peribacillus sp. NPDC096540 TaxID=3390612 RepID=UPI003CFF5947